jgi:hypothetical protein
MKKKRAHTIPKELAPQLNRKQRRILASAYAKQQ